MTLQYIRNNITVIGNVATSTKLLAVRYLRYCMPPRTDSDIFATPALLLAETSNETVNVIRRELSNKTCIDCIETRFRETQ